MAAASGEAQGAGEAEHEVHVLHPDVGASLAKAVQHARHDDAAALGVQIHADAAVVGACHHGDPGMRAVLPGSSLLRGQVPQAYEGLAPVEVRVELDELQP